MNEKVRGEDWVTFKLKADAPEHVALGGARFHGIWKRGDEPFMATAGEWRVFLEKTGWFELVEQG
jgi:hypothetical protein